jgi:DNA-binding NarL/FixJ family response regulator
MGSTDSRETKFAKDFAFANNVLAGDSIPKAIVTMMLETNERLAREGGVYSEREELVCRLLASGMPIEQISLILKIRAEEIRIIKSNHANIKIPEYTRTYKARAKSRERARK